MPCGRLLDQTSIRLVKDESDRGLGCGSAERTAEESAMGSRSLACALVRHRQAEPRGERRRRVFEAALQNGPKRDTRRRYYGAHTGSPRVSIDRTPAKGVTMSWVEREGPKRRGPDGTEQGLSPAGEKHLRPSECRFGTSAAACGREAAALAARDDASVGGGSRGRRLASPVCAGGAPQCSVGAAAEKEGRRPRPPQSASAPRRSAACSRSREPRLARRAAIVEST